ncbi:MAG: DNA-3-methyladenine glycosylase [Chloroflexi bacterium]|nr:DNA-3-methyladenine glycosylase [Chloroflexota bacterium]
MDGIRYFGHGPCIPRHTDPRLLHGLRGTRPDRRTRDRLSAFDRALLLGSPVDAARALLGARLVRAEPDRDRRIGRIVEVEAYGGSEDRASHARFGRTPRTSTMFGRAGRAYVYRVYGMYTCLNVVTGPDGDAGAVLVRAVEPVAGLEAIREARVHHDLERSRLTRGAGATPAVRDAAHRRIAALPRERLAQGPGLVGAAFSIVPGDDGVDLCDAGSTIRLAGPDPAVKGTIVAATTRIGIGFAGEPWVSLPWRFILVEDRAAATPTSRS